MRRSRLFAFMLLCGAAACSGGEEVPSCQQAITHFYASGCVFYDVVTGDQIPSGEMVAACRDTLAQAPASCDDDLDDWLFCTDSVPSNSSTSADCDCSQEQEALLTCG